MQSRPTFGDSNRGVQIGTYVDSSAGSGKTVLTSIAVNYLQELYKEDSEVGVACVYCEYKQQGLQTPTNLLASIWRQLDQWKDESHPEVQAVYNRRGRFGTKPTLDEVVSILRQEIWRHSVVFILIDALDECANDGRSRDALVAKLKETLAAKGPKSTRIQLLVTSRSPDNMFSDGAKIQIQATGEDIRSFISQRFPQGISRSGSISEDVRKNAKFKKWIIETVIEKADKIFLMARLHLDSLKYKTNLGDLREAVRCFPTGLDELYKDTWTRIASQDPEWRTLAHRTLGWLSSTFRQLNVEELCHALTVKSGDTVLNKEKIPAVDILCESCHGLVTIDEESRIVRLVHRTAQDFFDQHQAQYLPDIHTQISRACLDYLMLDVFAQGPCDFISNRPSDMGAAEGDISEGRLLSTRFSQNPFLDYAASYWGIHACGEPEHKIEGHILKFLQASAALKSFFQVQYSRLIFGGIQYNTHRLLDTSGSLLLHVAVSNGLEHIVNVLLGKLSSSEINGLDQRGKTALHWVALSGSESLTLALMQAGAEIDTQVRVDYSKFYRRCSTGYSLLSNLFFKTDRSEPIEPDVVPNEEVLENAVRYDMEIVIEMHIHSATNAAEKRGRANAVIWKASSLGKRGMLDISLTNGAEIEAREKKDVLTPQDIAAPNFPIKPILRKAKDQTALLMAVENGRVGATRALLSRRALISVTYRFGNDVLPTAVASIKVFDERLSLIENSGSESCLFDVTGLPGTISPSQMPRVEQEYCTKFSNLRALGPGMGVSDDTWTEPYQKLEDILHKDDEQVDIINHLLDSGV